MSNMVFDGVRRLCDRRALRTAGRARLAAASFRAAAVRLAFNLSICEIGEGAGLAAAGLLVTTGFLATAFLGGAGRLAVIFTAGFSITGFRDGEGRRTTGLVAGFAAGAGRRAGAARRTAGRLATGFFFAAGRGGAADRAAFFLR
jgi:hypothetical protein